MKIIGTLLLLIIVSCGSERTPYVKSIVDHRKDLHKEFRNPETSPLLEEDRRSFGGLKFFDIDSTFRVRARVERLPANDTFEMPATGDRTQHYVTFAIAHFELDGLPQTLEMYRNVTRESDYLFIPFKDKTSPDESYGGGRFLDLDIPQGDSIAIDFNKAYNPYCAYNYKYSCPIPPPENHLSVRVEAGEKNFEAQ